MSTPLVIGVTGGIAAFKTAQLVSRLVQSGREVTVVMTRAAERFVGCDTMAALSGRPVVRKLFDPDRFPMGAHIELARRGARLCVAPATADFLAKAAHGMADDVLTTLYLAVEPPVLMAPAMNPAMWRHPAVQRNVGLLESQDGVLFVPPVAGWVACRDEGEGRMAEPEQILERIDSVFDA